jgi:hypothetical protein
MALDYGKEMPRIEDVDAECEDGEGEELGLAGAKVYIVRRMMVGCKGREMRTHLTME